VASKECVITQLNRSSAEIDEFLKRKVLLLIKENINDFEIYDRRFRILLELLARVGYVAPSEETTCWLGERATSVAYMQADDSQLPGVVLVGAHCLNGLRDAAHDLVDRYFDGDDAQLAWRRSY